MAFLFITKTLILRPETDSGSGFQPLLGDAHVAACGMKIEGLRPFDASFCTKAGRYPLSHDHIGFL